jgi:hypothetical protein
MEMSVTNDTLGRLTERQRDVLFLVCKGFHMQAMQGFRHAW